MFDEHHRGRTSLIHEIKSHSLVETPVSGFVGGYIRRVTPVPIPNTVVKPAEPMILRQRESRSLPALNRSPRDRKVSGASFIAAPNQLRPGRPGPAASGKGS